MVEERGVRLAQTFVQLADVLVDGFDVMDLLDTLTTRCVEVLDAAAAGILLGDRDGGLTVVAASSEAARLLELFEVADHDGPCHECLAIGRPVVARTDDGQWPAFSAQARAAGYRVVQALPLRHRKQTLGALTVCYADSESPGPDDLLIAQALADAVTIAMLQDAAMREARLMSEQLQVALDSRVLIEQAKGIVAERHHLDMDQAFARLRRYARDHNRTLRAVAEDVVHGHLRL